LQAKEQLVAALRPTSSGSVPFILLDNLHWKHLAAVLEAFQASQSCEGKQPIGSAPQLPFLIATLNGTALMGDCQSAVIQQLQLHHSFRLYAFSHKMDAISGKAIKFV